MMIDAHPYLTRLNTFISPDEMNKDPFFFESRGPARRARTFTPRSSARCAATWSTCVQRARCGSSCRTGGWPGCAPAPRRRPARAASPSVAGLASLPAAEVAWQREETGEGMRVIDNTAAIAAGIAANNAKFPNEQTMFPIPSGTGGGAGGTTGVGGTVGMGSWGGSGGTGGSGSGVGGSAGGGDSGSGGVGPGSGGTGAPGTAGSGVTGTGIAGQAGPGGPQLRSSDGGCGCATGGLDTGMGVAAIAFACVFGLSLARRRRRPGA